jgi:hypothetical protein
MKKSKIQNLYQYLKDYSLTSEAADHFKEQLNFKVDQKIAQRKMVQLGRALGRIVTLNMTIKLGESGFNSELISNSIKSISNEIDMLVARYSSEPQPDVIVEYQPESSWAQFLK